MKIMFYTCGQINHKEKRCSIFAPVFSGLSG